MQMNDQQYQVLKSLVDREISQTIGLKQQSDIEESQRLGWDAYYETLRGIREALEQAIIRTALV